MTRFRWILLVGVLVGAGLIAWFATKPTSVGAVRLQYGPVVQTVVASGRVMPAAHIELGLRAPNNVLEVAVEEGEAVTAGQLLVRLDDAEAQAAVAQARASVAQAAAQLRRLGRVGAPLAREAAGRAELEVSLAQRELDRAAGLAEAGAYTASQLEEAQQAVGLARSRRQAAQVELQSAGRGGADQRVVMASLAQAEASVALAEARLGQTRIVAPSDGIILVRNVEPGDFAQPGMPLLTLAGAGPTRLRIEPDERNLAFLSRYQIATASTEAFPDLTFNASVAFIAPAVDPDRGTIEVRLDVDDPPDYLRPDMTVSVEVTVGINEGASLLPRAAVRRAERGGAYVIVDDGAGRAAHREVSVGIRGDDKVEIKEGLDVDDLVIIDPSVQPGDRIEVAETPAD